MSDEVRHYDFPVVVVVIIAVVVVVVVFVPNYINLQHVNSN
jgi:hypothetical protein